MEPMKAILLGLKIVSELAPILLPQMIAIAKGVDGISSTDLITIDEFNMSIDNTKAKVKKWSNSIR